MKKKYIILILLNLFFLSIYCQDSGHKIVEGKCYKIIQKLQNDTQNDSLAVIDLVENYVVINKPSNLNFQNYKAIINHFKENENKECICLLKQFYFKNTLLHKKKRIETRSGTSITRQPSKNSLKRKINPCFLKSGFAILLIKN